jgi:hypothetical protein
MRSRGSCPAVPFVRCATPIVTQFYSFGEIEKRLQSAAGFRPFVTISVPRHDGDNRVNYKHHNIADCYGFCLQGGHVY